MAVAVCLTGLISPSAQAGVSFGLFYDNLSPYGSWQVSARYGRVWQPAEETEGWNPYYDGHWVYTDVGWTWISDYEWGAIPYHYGTWTLDPAFGWVWVPGTVWAPAWVVFRTGPDYIGWAPVAPGFSVGVSFRSGRSSAVPFTFVPTGSFLSRRVRTCVVPQSRTTVVINNTRIVNNLVVENNVVVNRGPDLTVIEKASGRRVHAMPIERVSRVAPGPHFTRDELHTYVRQQCHYSRHFTRYLSALLANIVDETDRRDLVQNRPHIRLPRGRHVLGHIRGALGDRPVGRGVLEEHEPVCRSCGKPTVDQGDVVLSRCLRACAEGEAERERRGRELHRRGATAYRREYPCRSSLPPLPETGT